MSGTRVRDNVPYHIAPHNRPSHFLHSVELGRPMDLIATRDLQAVDLKVLNLTVISRHYI